jgi:hypothetical protein
MRESWYWFGVLVDRAGGVKLRQYHVEFDHIIGAYRLWAWSKGLSGKLWYVCPKQHLSRDFVLAVDLAKEAIDRLTRGYTVVDEGEPPTPRFDEQASQPQGMAHPDWWAALLGVMPDAHEKEVRSAFRQKAKETHPDAGGDEELFKQVYAAWSYIKEQKGW